MYTTDDKSEFREYIRILERRLGLLNENQMACCSVSLTQCHAIVEIGKANELSLNKLAEILNLDNSTMSRTVNNLVNNGLAKRELDSQDRRYVTISLTDEGVKIFEEIEVSTDLYYKKVFNSIPENKRNQVLESLHILLHVLDKNDCCKQT